MERVFIGNLLFQFEMAHPAMCLMRFFAPQSVARWALDAVGVQVNSRHGGRWLQGRAQFVAKSFCRPL